MNVPGSVPILSSGKYVFTVFLMSFIQIFSRNVLQRPHFIHKVLTFFFSQFFWVLCICIILFIFKSKPTICIIFLQSLGCFLLNYNFASIAMCFSFVLKKKMVLLWWILLCAVFVYSFGWKFFWRKYKNLDIDSFE